MVREGMNIPHHWECKTLVECTSNKNISYGIVQPGQHDDNGVGIIRVNNFESGGLNTSDVLKVSPSIEAKFAKTRLNGGEVLLTLVGSTGQSAVVPSELKGWNVPRAVAVIRPSEDVSAEWINICLQSAHTKHFLDARANTTVQKTLNLKDVKDIPIPLPPVAERQRLEDIAVGLEKKITLNRQISQTLEQMAQTLFKSWFVDFDPVIDNALDAGNPIPDELQHRAEARKAVRQSQAAASKEHEGFKPLPDEVRQLFPDAFEESELGWVPKGWETKPLSEVTSLIIDHRGKTPKKLGGDWSENGHPAISAKNIKAGRLVRRDTIRYVDTALFDKWMKNPLAAGDIIMTSEAPMGEMLYLSTSSDFLLSQRLYGIRAESNLISGCYLYFWLQTKKAKSDLDGRATGTTVVGIRQSELRQVNVMTPNKDVIDAFTELASSYLKKCDANEAQSTQLEILRDTLLPKLISGELRLDDAEATVEQDTVSA